MIKYILIILIPFVGRSQDSVQVEWEETFLLEIDSTDFWTMDILGNHFVYSETSIQKLNPKGEHVFSQSIKSLGELTDFDPINPMKIVHFSEEQQRLCYFDNTLTPTDDCLELAEKDIINASHISVSGQPNKVWVLDNVNSTLRLLALNGSDQGQEIANLRGTLDAEHVVQLLERGNKLYLLDPEVGVIVLDVYGSLIDVFRMEGITRIDAMESTIIGLSGDVIYVHSLIDGYTEIVPLPISNVTDLLVGNQQIYLRNNQGIHQFNWQKSE